MSGLILGVGYADLVREPETTVRKTFEFFELEWELDFLTITRTAFR